MLELIKKSTQVTKFNVHDVYLLTVTKHSIRLEGPSGEDFDQGGFQRVLVDTEWELELAYLTLEGGKHLCSCQSERWGDSKGQEGPWSITNALRWLGKYAY